MLSSADYVRMVQARDAATAEMLQHGLVPWPRLGSMYKGERERPCCGRRDIGLARVGRKAVGCRGGASLSMAQKNSLNS